MNDLRERGLQDKIEVYIDGGIRRGTDIFKVSSAGSGTPGMGCQDGLEEDTSPMERT